MSLRLPNPLPEAVWRTIHKQDSALSRVDRWRLHEVYLFHCLENGQLPRHTQLREATERQSSWKRAVIARLLKRLPSAQVSQTCPLTGYSVDVSLPQSNHAFLLVDEFKCGSEYEYPDGISNVKRQLLERVGWTVVSIRQSGASEEIGSDNLSKPVLQDRNTAELIEEREYIKNN
jgi:hypothetical protein